MINFKEEIAKILKNELTLSLEDILKMIEVPQDSKMGDYAFPCFRLAKEMQKAPNLIASDIANSIKDNVLFDDVVQVNAYVNMFLSKDVFLKDALNSAIDMGDDYGRSNYGEGRPVIVEYSSPNIAKPFHIGHIRSTVIGNSLYKIYDKIGYKVTRINHLGDYGTQFGKMIVAYRKWGNEDDVKREPIKTLLSYYTKFHVEAESDPSLEEEARLTFVKLEKGEKEEVRLWKWFREESLKEFNRVYDMLGISFDSYNGESFYSDKMPYIIEELKNKNLLVESRGAQIVDLEPYGLTACPIIKSDGSSLYITRDLAAAKYRKETYNFDKCIYVVASQQNLHFQQLKKIIELMGYEWNKDIVHVPFGLVSLEEGTMSTRHGRVVFLEDVLNNAIEKTKEIIIEKGVNTDSIDDTAKKIGIGAVVFNELSNSKIKDYVFSWNKVLDFNGETGPYVQYTYARCASIIRNAEGVLPKVNTKYLKGDSAFELSRLIYDFPNVIIDAAEKYEPSIVTRHIVNIAEAFNRFYHDEHILVDNEEEKASKLSLVVATMNTIKSGLGLLGIETPERM